MCEQECEITGIYFIFFGFQDKFLFEIGFQDVQKAPKSDESDSDIRLDLIQRIHAII